MKSRLFNLMSLLSAVLLVATVVLWVRSYWAIDHFGTWSRGPEGKVNPFVVDRSSGVFSHRGSVLLVRAEDKFLLAAYGQLGRQVPPFFRHWGWTDDPESAWPVKLVGGQGADVVDAIGFRWGYAASHSSWAALPSTAVGYVVTPPVLPYRSETPEARRLS